MSCGLGRAGPRWALPMIGCAVLALSGCIGDAPAGTPAALFDHPPAAPGYAWTFQGRGVSSEVIASEAGPAHCGWESVTFLSMGWPPGTSITRAAPFRQYLRDPRKVLSPQDVHAQVELHAQLPGDAKPTGLRYQGVELYVSPPTADTALYVVGGGAVERWPRIDPPIGCS